MGAVEDYIYKRVCESQEFFESYVQQRIETAVAETLIRQTPVFKNEIYDPRWVSHTGTCPGCGGSTLELGHAPAWGPFPGLIRCTSCVYQDSVVGYQSEVAEKPKKASFSLPLIK